MELIELPSILKSKINTFFYGSSEMGEEERKRYVEDDTAKNFIKVINEYATLSQSMAKAKNITVSIAGAMIIPSSFASLAYSNEIAAPIVTLAIAESVSVLVMVAVQSYYMSKVKEYKSLLLPISPKENTT